MIDASLSLDLDNKWAYLRAAGREDWETVDSFLPLAIDRIVETLGGLDLPLTVFLVGRDFKNATDVHAIESFNRLPNWEAANHSLNHLPWMHTMADDEIHDEIAQTHQSIVQATDRTPIGFRGPGFSCPEQVLRVLADLDYVYDASIFPTSMAPIARAVFLARTKLKGEQREKAKQLYGGFASMRQPNRPFERSIDASTLWEIPVSVMPFVRTPIHFSYVTFLAGFSMLAAKTYFRSALRLCRLTGTSPSLLLHPPDFLGHEDDQDLAYFPGMKLSAEKKLAFMRWALALFSEQFEVKTLADQVDCLDPGCQATSRTLGKTTSQEASAFVGSQ